MKKGSTKHGQTTLHLSEQTRTKARKLSMGILGKENVSMFFTYVVTNWERLVKEENQLK